MKFSRTYINKLKNVFQICDTSTSESLLSIVTLDKHNVYNKLFVLDISSDNFEIPVFMRGAVETKLFCNNNCSTDRTDYKKVVIPLYSNCYSIVGKTADSIITKLFSCSYNSRICKAFTSSNEIYYGGKGLILDKDFTPLLMCSIKYVNDNSRLRYYQPILHVSPKVFVNDTSMIEKSIVRKVIPFYLTHDISFVLNNYNRYINSEIVNPKVQLVVEDIKGIETPSIPTPRTFSNEDANNFLQNHMEELLSIME